MLRGPIRRRPYNRGEIVAKNAKEMGVFYDFYYISVSVRRPTRDGIVRAQLAG